MSEKALVRSKELWLSQNQGQFSCLLNHRFIGVSSTSALATTRPKKGPHRSHISVSTDEGVKTFNVVLSKEVGRSRDNEDDVVSRLMLKAVLESKQISAASLNKSLTNHDDVFDDMIKLFMDSGDEVVEKVTLRQDALDNFLENIEKHQVPSGEEVIKYKKDVFKKQDNDSPYPPHEKPENKNVLFIPYSMLKDQETTTGEAGSFKRDNGFLTYPNFKPKQRVIVYPGSFNPLHKVNIQNATSHLTPHFCNVLLLLIAIYSYVASYVFKNVIL